MDLGEIVVDLGVIVGDMGVIVVDLGVIVVDLKAAPLRSDARKRAMTSTTLRPRASGLQGLPWIAVDCCGLLWIWGKLLWIWGKLLWIWGKLLWIWGKLLWIAVDLG